MENLLQTENVFAQKALSLFSTAQEENKTCLVIVHEDDGDVEVFLNGKNTPISYGLFEAAKQSDRFREIIKEVSRRLSVVKTVIFILLLSLPAFAQSQIFVDFAGGVETSKIYPVGHISAGYEHNNIVIEAVEQFTITRAVNSSNYLGLKVGYNVHNFVPAVGYYYNYRNADNKEQNHGAAGYSLKYILILGEIGGPYAEALYIEKSVQFTVGFHINILK